MTQNPPSESQQVDSQELQPTPTFAFRFGEQVRELTYQQAFALSHSLTKAKKFDQASAILEKLITVTDRGPRAHILFAICKAGLSDYKASRALLDSVFSGELATLAEALQVVIVGERMGFKADAIQELLELVNEHKELPTLCLWLGDLLQANQQQPKAIQCWKLAIQRDRPNGAVALAAQQQLKKIQSS